MLFKWSVKKFKKLNFYKKVYLFFKNEFKVYYDRKNNIYHN